MSNRTPLQPVSSMPPLSAAGNHQTAEFTVGEMRTGLITRAGPAYAHAANNSRTEYHAMIETLTRYNGGVAPDTSILPHSRRTEEAYLEHSIRKSLTKYAGIADIAPSGIARPAPTQDPEHIAPPAKPEPTTAEQLIASLDPMAKALAQARSASVFDNANKIASTLADNSDKVALTQNAAAHSTAREL